MLAMGFEFDHYMTMTEADTVIYIMECWLTINYQQVKRLPFVLTIEESKEGYHGLLSLDRGDCLSFVPVEAQSEDEFFATAHQLVEDWLFDFTWDGKP